MKYFKKGQLVIPNGDFTTSNGFYLHHIRLARVTKYVDNVEKSISHTRVKIEILDGKAVKKDRYGNRVVAEQKNIEVFMHSLMKSYRTWEIPVDEYSIW